MPFFNVPLTYNGMGISVFGFVVYDTSLNFIYNQNDMALLTNGFVMGELEWNPTDLPYPAVWVSCDCGFNCS